MFVCRTSTKRPVFYIFSDGLQLSLTCFLVTCNATLLTRWSAPYAIWVSWESNPSSSVLIASCNDPCVSTDVTPLTMLRKEVHQGGTQPLVHYYNNTCSRICQALICVFMRNNLSLLNEMFYRHT